MPTMQVLSGMVETRHIRPEIVAEYEKQISEMIGAKRPNVVDEMLAARRTSQPAPEPEATQSSLPDDDMREFYEE